MKIKRGYIIGISAGLLIILVALVFLYLDIKQDYNLMNIVYFLFGVGILIILSPFVLSSILENRIQREKNEMFLEFARGLVESVNSGTPISKSIINMKSKKFGTLGPHIEKLANQIKLGIPIQKALETFAYDTKSKTIIRAITLIREANKTGGDIESILESVAKSVAEVEKLKAERRSAISSIVLEGYIIFFIFIVIMIVMEVQILPMTTNIAGISTVAGETASISVSGLELGGNAGKEVSDLSIAFMSLLVTQGFFAGLIIGKLSEGTIKAGIKHSFIMVAMAILIFTGSKLFFG